MRTTVRIDDDLLLELKEYAHQQGTSVAKLVNQTLRLGFDNLKNRKAKPFRQKTFDTGVPYVDLTKANQLAAELEDEEIIHKMRTGQW